MAAALMVLLPTFNALNDSYVTDVAPPAWLAKLIDPNDLPEDFQPPEDFVPPEDFELPEDFEPPEGWEIPPGYDGPIPPGGCGPPVKFTLDEMDGSGPIEPNWDGVEFTFELPEYTVAVVANVTFTNWQATRVFAILTSPVGDAEEDEADGDPPGLLSGGASQPPAEFSLQFITDPEDLTTMPPAGTYTLELGAELGLTGSYTTQVEYAVYCGGMLG